MSRGAKARELLLPWAGLIGAALGAGIAHQTGSDWIFADCPDSTRAAVLLAGLAGLLLIGVGAFGSWTVWSRKGEEPARRLLAGVSLGISALALFAILLPMIAALVIPTCFA